MGKARRALLRPLEEPDGVLALRVLERVLPELAPPRQRMDVGGGIAKINWSMLTDHQLSRIASGEHRWVVLARSRDPLEPATRGELHATGEVLQLPPVVDEHSED